MYCCLKGLEKKENLDGESDFWEAHRHSRCGVIDARVKRRGIKFRETGNVDHEIQRDAERIGASSWPSTRFKHGKSGRSHQSSSQATKGGRFSVTVPKRAGTYR